MILSFKKFDKLLLYLSLKVGVNLMNFQHLRLKWHFEKLYNYGPYCLNHLLAARKEYFVSYLFLFCILLRFIFLIALTSNYYNNFCLHCYLGKMLVLS